MHLLSLPRPVGLGPRPVDAPGFYRHAVWRLTPYVGWAWLRVDVEYTAARSDERRSHGVNGVIAAYVEQRQCLPEAAALKINLNLTGPEEEHQKGCWREINRSGPRSKQQVTVVTHREEETPKLRNSLAVVEFRCRTAAAEKHSARVKVASGEKDARVKVASGEKEARVKVASGEKEARVKVASGEKEARVKVASGEKEARLKVASGEKVARVKVASGEKEARVKVASGEQEARVKVTGCRQPRHPGATGRIAGSSLYDGLSAEVHPDADFIIAEIP
ncbi:hypothetical protein EYF80_045207 [Liparis tanakae]|uniref:Uncharacterized protein n=1 Tax=Liparis tanakae TaxID=230148 RepID=A0A4Z2FUP6_9TELE|nr:hypothetical protein EYF80_045207 [Liparis tanakae]